MAPRWHLAQNLAERQEALNRSGPVASAASSALSQRRLARWKSSAAFADDGQLAQFLARENLSEATFLSALADQHEPANYPWLTDLEASAATDRLIPDYRSFLNLLAPLMSYFATLLQDEVKNLAELSPSLPFDPAILPERLMKRLQIRLERLIQRTLVLETNIARLEGRLQGETPEQRFEDFVRSLKDAAVRRQILHNYPVLARRAVGYARQWLAASTEFLRHVSTDYADLEVFLGAPLGPLVAVSGAVGDAHRQGRSVAICEFASGTKVVYKPRPVATEKHFQSLIDALNTRGLTPPLRTVKVLDRGDYGWAEYIPFQACDTEEDVSRFYERQGSWLAILHTLGATDLHLENIVACGEHPVLVDLETLFHPRLVPLERTTADDFAFEKLAQSVMAVGLLPTPLHTKGHTFDVSGLGASANQTTPFEVDSLAEPGTDVVHIAKAPSRIHAVHNRPVLKKSSVDLAEHRGDIEAGFARTYHFLLQHRQWLQSQDGPLTPFLKVPSRAVLRPSSTYAALLAESLHPKILGNALDQELLFSQLWRQVEKTPVYAALVASEKCQLLDGDIPYFATEPGSQDLVGADGTNLPGLLDASGFEIVTERLAAMGPDDLATQLWFIKASLASLGAASPSSSDRRPAPQAYASFLEAASAVGDHLVATAVRAPRSATWLSLRHVTRQNMTGQALYNMGIAHDDLYSGLSGIALFLAYLAKLTGKSSHRTLAEDAFATIQARLAQPGLADTRRHLGAFNGLSGLIYIHTHLAVLWQRPELLDQACDLLPELDLLIRKDEILDVIGGSAGAIPILLALAEHRPASRAKALAEQCGERLLALGWSTLHVPRGFSHGLAGVAWALSELAAATKRDDFARTALAALRAERELVKDGHWSDTPENPTQSAWCHGAPGIALSRLAMYSRKSDEATRADALAALTVACNSRESGKDHILCHGVLGNLDCLQAAANVFPEDSHWAAERKARGQKVLDEINQTGWCLPLPLPIAEPGLMMGVAGIGFGLLRLASPASIPAVLTLAGPPRS